MKIKKRITLILIALILIPSITFGAMTWRGSQPATNTKNNLTLISEKMNTLKNESGNKDQTIREIQILLEQETALREQRDREMQDKQKEIEQKNAEIQVKDGRINELNHEVEQALRDVIEIEQITNDMLN